MPDDHAAQSVRINLKACAAAAIVVKVAVVGFLGRNARLARERTMVKPSGSCFIR